MDHDDDDDAEAEQLVTVLARPSERSADEAARALVEHGLGAVVQPMAMADAGSAGGAGSGDDATGDAADAGLGRLGGAARGGFAVRVMPHQVERACAVLGVEVPATVSAELHADDKEPPAPWKRILIIWAVAMVVIPLVAGLAAYFLLQ